MSKDIIERISSDLVVEEAAILNVIKNSKNFYRKHQIPKRNGKLRTIYQPSAVLKTLQYWVIQNVLYIFPISDYAYAYQPGSSIKLNAQVHKNNKYFLHMDILNFFESIDINKISNFFKKDKTLLEIIDIADDDLRYIYDIVLYKNHTAIGSVSSPVISNIIMHSFDIKLRELLPANTTYTRYADDMIISSEQFLDPSIINLVTECVEMHGFSINNKKTYFMSHKGRRMITGLLIDRGKVSIGLQRKKEIKSMLYNKLKYNKGDSRKILGHLSFLKDIEPDYYFKIIDKYSYFGNVIELLKNKDQEVDQLLNPFDEVAVTSEN